MKKAISIFSFLVLLIPIVVFANSGPVTWEGYPAAEMMTVDADSPIEVKKEELVFDFSVDTTTRYAPNGTVTAAYTMVNPTDEPLSVEMAFPLVGRMDSRWSKSLSVQADGQALSYDAYIGKAPDSDETMGFTAILGDITDTPYKAEYFTKEEQGKCYTFDVRPTTEQRINFKVNFSYDPAKTRVFTKKFRRYLWSEGKTMVSTWCYEPETLEIYVLGEDITLQTNAYTDGALTEKTDLYTCVVSSRAEKVGEYLLAYAEKDAGIDNPGQYSETQLYNVYAKTLDEMFTDNASFCSDTDFSDQEYRDRIFTIVYSVDFPAHSEKNISVSYAASGTMDRRDTVTPLYTYEYILNPARYWSDFNDLNIKIITPKKAPYVIESSIPLTPSEEGVYTASLDTLPETDLSFTLFEKSKVTPMDKVMAWLNGIMGYLIIGIIGIVVCGLLLAGLVLAIVWIVKKAKKKRNQKKDTVS